MGKHVGQSVSLLVPLLLAVTFAPAVAAEEGILQFRANGEDFVRQGFTSKDGWEISFDHLYVSLSELTAFQTDPPFDPESGSSLNATAEARFANATVVDLAAGDEAADPILVGELPATAGRYNALSWTMRQADQGPASGQTLVLVGTATQGDTSIDFNLKFDREYTYTCGDFVGDERKGILSPGENADIEATFHFDHIFGDGEAPPDDPINTGALGFGPLAAVAEGGTLNADQSMLEEQLAAEDFATLISTLDNLGHVGEGHCEHTILSSN